MNDRKFKWALLAFLTCLLALGLLLVVYNPGGILYVDPCTSLGIWTARQVWNCRTIAGSLIIKDEDLVVGSEAVVRLDKLSEISGNFGIISTKLVGTVLLPKLSVVKQDIVIQANDALAQFQAPNMKFVKRGLTVRYNNKLNELDFSSLEDVGERVSVWENAQSAHVNLSSLLQVGKCLELDSRNVNLSKLVLVYGSLVLDGSYVIALPVLRVVSGDLQLGNLDVDGVRGPDAVVLPQLYSVEGDLRIYPKSKFLGLVSFPELVWVKGSLHISHGHEILFDRLQFVGGDLVLTGAPGNRSLAYFNLLQTVEGLFLIDSSELDTLQVFASLTRVGAALRLQRLSRLPEIRFPDLREVGGLELFDCRENMTLDLPVFEHVSSLFRVAFMDGLRFSVPKLENVGGPIEVIFSKFITKLDMPALNAAGALVLRYNEDLEDLSGLKSLKMLFGPVTIEYNKVKTSAFSKIAGLDVKASRVHEKNWNCTLVEDMGLPASDNNVECLKNE